MESNSPLNFNIAAAGPVSAAFMERGIFTFCEAMEFIRQLPYRRNKNKEDLPTVFGDGGGTCSTKHALLKQLAIENSADFVTLKLGIFKMNGRNTPKVSATLAKYGLEYIPEAHNYLLVGSEIVDCTSRNSRMQDFIDDLVSEIEIESSQISTFKVNYHKKVLANWLRENVQVRYSLYELWAIREECIGALQVYL